MGEERERRRRGVALQGERGASQEEGVCGQERGVLKPKCYFCDTELEVALHTFKVGPRDEPVCEECYVKTANRMQAKAEEDERRDSG